MDDPELEVQTLYEERLVAVLPLHHPLAQKDTLTISDICEEPFIISTEGFQTRRDILTSFEQAGKTSIFNLKLSVLKPLYRLYENI